MGTPAGQFSTSTDQNKRRSNLNIVEPLIRQFSDVALSILEFLLSELPDEERSEKLVVPVKEACSKLERCEVVTTQWMTAHP